MNCFHYRMQEIMLFGYCSESDRKSGGRLQGMTRLIGNGQMT